MRAIRLTALFQQHRSNHSVVYKQSAAFAGVFCARNGPFSFFSSSAPRTAPLFRHERRSFGVYIKRPSPASSSTPSASSKPGPGGAAPMFPDLDFANRNNDEEEEEGQEWNPDIDTIENLLDRPNATMDDYEKATVVLEENIIKEPEVFDHRLNKARLHMEMENYELAAEYFRDAEKYAKTNADQAKLKFWFGILSDMEGNHLEAVELFTESLRLDPDPMVLFNRGVALVNAGKPREAVADLDKAVAADPKNPFYHYQRGCALGALGRVHDAILSFQKSISLDPTHMQAYYNLGVCKRKLGRHAEAIEIFTFAIDFGEKWIRQYEEDEELDDDLVEDMHDLYYERGCSFMIMEKFQDALNDFDRGVKFSGDDRVKSARGECLFRMDRWEEAEAAFTDAMMHSENNADLYVARAGCRFSMMRLPEALEDYSKALELDSRHASAYHDRGRLYQVAKNPERALADYDMAIKWDPSTAIYWASRGSLRLILDRNREALDDLEKALELDPSARPMLLANLNAARQRLNMSPVQPTAAEAAFLERMAAQDPERLREEAAEAALQQTLKETHPSRSSKAEEALREHVQKKQEELEKKQVRGKVPIVRASSKKPPQPTSREELKIPVEPPKPLKSKQAGGQQKSTKK